MDNKSLKLFLSLSETLHFGRASELCHVSPSTLSRTIKQLEERLGVQLLERDNRTVTLTPQGILFQQYAREALQHWEMFNNSLLEGSRELQGSLSIYCSVTASYSFLYDILRDFRQQHPKVELKLHTGDPAAAIARVLNGEEDLTIAARPEKMPAGLAFKPIARSPLVFIAPLESQWLEVELDKPISARQWAEIPMILSEEGLARERTDNWFRARDIKPNIYAQVTGNEAIVSMVGLGFGVGIVPQIVLENSPLADRVRILNIEPALEPYDVGLCTLEKRLPNPLIKALWALL